MKKRQDKLKDNVFLYRLTRPIITHLFKFFYRPEYICQENIPMDGPIILAGNHTSILDCLLLISSTKRSIHFLAKLELFRGFKGIIFNNMGLIPVDRKYKTTKPLNEAEKYLNIGGIVLIFPEGTTSKNLLEFKLGSVALANRTNNKIVPFVISGKYRIFKRGLKIKFLSPIDITDDITKENERLRKIIKNELEVI